MTMGGDRRVSVILICKFDQKGVAI